MPQSPQLLLPAGSLDKMRTAFSFGADAVYAGHPRYSLRARNNEFRLEHLRQGIQEAHALGKAFYVTANIMAHNGKVRSFLENMEPVIACQPDALIMSDPGLIMLVRERWPDMAIHLSVQANTVNYASVRFWQSVGLKRIILSRELSLDEVEEIRQNCPDMELEVFVHGALCMAYSGRCLLAGYFNHRDANQGTCTNACRWQYDLKPAQENATGDLEVAPSAYLLEQTDRPGELMPMEEDEHGTYILNSKDMRALEHVQRLVEIGVDSLKIEGRTKSSYYVARTTQSYRKAIDDAVSGRGFDPALLADLEGLANRGYTDGFFQRHHDSEYQNYLAAHSASNLRLYVGDVLSYDAARELAEVDVKNGFAVGDHIELVQPAGNRIQVLERMLDRQGEPISGAPGSGHRVWIQLPGARAGDLLARCLVG